MGFRVIWTNLYRVELILEFDFHGSVHHVLIFVNKTSLMQFFRYLLYPSPLYMFRMLRPSILRSTVMYRREGTVYVRMWCVVRG